MRPKRHKPERERGRGSFGRRHLKDYGRQIDADLTEDELEQTDVESSESTALRDPHIASGSAKAASRKTSGSNQTFKPDFSSNEFEGADLPVMQQQGVDQLHVLSAAEPPPVTPAIVRDRAVRLLANREHGRKELEQKLLQRALPPDLIVSVLDQLAQEGLQCDARFAESYTRMRVDRGYGANKIRADLQTRRLEQSVIEQAISDYGADWAGVAGGALSKKFGRRPVSDAKARAKLQRFLYQRGFAAEEIRSAMNNYESVDSDLWN